ncbi:MAG: glycosyltransferase family 4 protein [Deltaproteobacteria bacterium]|nr:glycosyltransferase family 4 protein [Deltaproteobacteria bacterium]
MKKQYRPIAYLARKLPTSSETFVIREIAALRQLGAEVRLISLYSPDPSVVHPELPEAAGEAFVAWQPKSVFFWMAHAYFALFHPLRYFGCIRICLLTPGETRKNRLRCLIHFLMAPSAAGYVRQNDIGHIHAHFANTATTVAMLAARLAGISFSFTAHAYDIFLDDTLMSPKLSSALFVAVCSWFNLRYLHEHYPEAVTARIEVVRYGVDPAALGLVSPVKRTRWSTTFSILAVGRLVVTKGFHTLIEACALLKGRGIDFSCLIIGSGPEEPRLKRLVEKLDLTSKVRFAGMLQPAEALKYYPQADVLVMPSCVRHNDRDGIPNVLLEAMVMGVPVISTRVSGIPELVRDGETGLLVEPDDPVALAEAIERLTRRDGLAERLAGSGKTLIAAEFDISGSARQLLRLFRGGPSQM